MAAVKSSGRARRIAPVYYNEWDAYPAQWLRNLMAAGLIPEGDVDERSIKDVGPGDLKGYRQCHFFAGLGGWSFALQQAGWPEDRVVWTGSCPCQPFSLIGKGNGFDDERHLWPEWKRLIRPCKPPTIFGEQVPNALSWLDLVLSDLETEDYSCGAIGLPAAAFGARHERVRLWFVADSNEARRKDLERSAAAKTKANVRVTSSLVHSITTQHLRGAFEPNEDWIVDGLLAAGDAVSAYGNSIVAACAAEFIKAYREVIGL